MVSGVLTSAPFSQSACLLCPRVMTTPNKGNKALKVSGQSGPRFELGVARAGGPPLSRDLMHRAAPR